VSALPDGAQITVPIVEQSLSRARRSLQSWTEVHAVHDAVARNLGTRQSCRGGEQVKSRAYSGDDARTNRTGPPEDRRRSHTALPRRTLPISKRTGRPAVVSVREPGPVVTREQYESVAVDSDIPKGVEDSPDAPVELL